MAELSAHAELRLLVGHELQGAGVRTYDLTVPDELAESWTLRLENPTISGDVAVRVLRGLRGSSSVERDDATITFRIDPVAALGLRDPGEATS